MEPSFDIYTWLDEFNVIPVFGGRLQDIPNWIDVILSMIPEQSQHYICRDNISIELPKPRTIARKLRVPTSDIIHLHDTNLSEYVKMAKQVAMKDRAYVPNRFGLVVEDQTIIENPINDINPLLKEDIEACPQPLILILIKVVTVMGLKVKSSHANALIIDKNKKTFELFDPYGKTIPAIDEWFDTSFRSTANLPDYQYLSPMTLCPITSGPQYLAEKTSQIEKSQRGYCYTYTMMYIQMRLANPHLIPQDIIGLILDVTPEQLRRYAGMYNTVLHEYYNWPLRYD